MGRKTEEEIVFTKSIPVAQEVNDHEDPLAGLSKQRKQRVKTILWVAIAVAVQCLLILWGMMWFMANIAGGAEEKQAENTVLTQMQQLQIFQMEAMLSAA